MMKMRTMNKTLILKWLLRSVKPSEKLLESPGPTRILMKRSRLCWQSMRTVVIFLSTSSPTLSTSSTLLSALSAPRILLSSQQATRASCIVSLSRQLPPQTLSILTMRRPCLKSIERSSTQTATLSDQRVQVNLRTAPTSRLAQLGCCSTLATSRA